MYCFSGGRGAVGVWRAVPSSVLTSEALLLRATHPGIPHLRPHPGLIPHCIPTSGHTQGSFRTASPPPATPRAHSTLHPPPPATPRAYSALHPHLRAHPGLIPHCIPTSGHTQGSFRTAYPPPATPRAHSALPHLRPHPGLILHCIPTSGHTQSSFRTASPPPGTPRAHSALHPHLRAHPGLIPHCIPTSSHTQGSFRTLQPCPQRFPGGDIRLLVGCHPKETLPCCLVTLAVFSSACSD